jgi:hypothetical protein
MYIFVLLGVAMVEFLIGYKNYAESALLEANPTIQDWVWYSWMAVLLS